MRSYGRVVLYALSAATVTLALAEGCGGSGNSGSSSGSSSGEGNRGGTSNGSSSSGKGGSGVGGNSGSSNSGAGGQASNSTSGSISTSTSTSTSGAGGGGVVVESPCQGHIYQCGDTIDNDMDGLLDYQDPDCLGPCDNTEDGYYGGIPGQSGPACTVDCYFDQDSGSGNDDCHWNHQCDPHEVGPEYYPEHDEGVKCQYDQNANTPGTGSTCAELYVMQSNACLTYCGPLTPNGCDCFGCCELPAGGGKYVWLGSEINGQGSCDIANVADPTKCQPCLPVQACLNTCDTCEICIGKPMLPPECFPDAGGSSSSVGSASSSSAGGGGASGSSSTGSSSSSGGMQCPPGVQACGLPGQPLCPSGYYCITGCCQKIPG